MIAMARESLTMLRERSNTSGTTVASVEYPIYGTEART
jgi:hypothetical protein